MADELRYERYGRHLTVAQAVELSLSGEDYERDDIATIEARLSDHGEMMGKLVTLLLARGSFTVAEVDDLLGYRFKRVQP